LIERRTSAAAHPDFIPNTSEFSGATFGKFGAGVTTPPLPNEDVMHDGTAAGSSKTSVATGVGRRLQRILPSGIGLVVFGSAVAALATNGRGCAVAPYHTSTARFGASAATLPVEFAGEINDNATQVTIQAGKLVKNDAGPAILSQLTTLATLTPQPNAAGKKQFKHTVNVPRNLWPNDDIGGFQVLERLANGTQQVMGTLTPNNEVTSHSSIGIADLPEPSLFPSTINPFATKLPGQDDNTFLSVRGVGLGNDNYYNQFGLPPNSFNTLEQWKFLTGFPNGEVVTYYRNENDLGFGREMHCRKITASSFGMVAKAACYVTNYANENDAATGTNRAATVAMDFDVSRVDSVRFVVYGANGQRLNQVQLDGGGPKPVPQLCLNCHGGDLGTDNKVRGAHFLPFDIAYLPTPDSKGPQLAQFKAQNAIVWAVERNFGTKPAEGGNNAIIELIEGWYGSRDGVFDQVSPYDAGFVPPGWSEAPDAYLAAVAPYCRTCHVAQSRRPDLLWNTRQQLFVTFKGSAAGRVCTKPQDDFFVMPHAQRTYQKFWLSGAQAIFAVDMGLANCAFKPLVNNP
jgi:hypothetical protein